MKTVTIILLAFLAASVAFTQEETIMDDKNFESGGYGAVTTKFTSVNGQFGLLVGGRGGWIINHSIVIGGAGYGLANNVDANTHGPLGEPYVNLGYGGLDLEVVINSDQLVHYSVHALIGGGAVSFRNDWMDEGNRYHRSQDGFFVFEPGATVDLNVATWFRTSLGVTYRYVDGVDSGASTDSDLRGPSAMLAFRFGSF